MADQLIIQRFSDGLKVIVKIEDLEDPPNPIDLSPFDTFILFLERPDQTILEVNAKLLNNGVDGKIYFLTDERTLLITGRWHVQAKYGTGLIHIYTSINTFMLDDNLDTEAE